MYQYAPSNQRNQYPKPFKFSLPCHWYFPWDKILANISQVKTINITRSPNQAATLKFPMHDGENHRCVQSEPFQCPATKLTTGSELLKARPSPRNALSISQMILISFCVVTFPTDRPTILLSPLPFALESDFLEAVPFAKKQRQQNKTVNKKNKNKRSVSNSKRANKHGGQHNVVALVSTQVSFISKKHLFFVFFLFDV